MEAGDEGQPWSGLWPRGVVVLLEGMAYNWNWNHAKALESLGSYFMIILCRRRLPPAGRVLLLDTWLAHAPCGFREQLKWSREQNSEFLSCSPVFPTSYFLFLRVHRLCMAYFSMWHSSLPKIACRSSFLDALILASRATSNGLTCLSWSTDFFFRGICLL